MTTAPSSHPQTIGPATGRPTQQKDEIMAKYVFIYHAPTTPADAAPPSPEQMEAVMGQWNAWAGRVGERMLDFGTPLAGGVRVTPDGTSPSTRDVAGYSIVEADDYATALELVQGHPHLSMPGGCEVEVHEAQAIPGM
jgi:hypothetical protein